MLGRLAATSRGSPDLADALQKMGISDEAAAVWLATVPDGAKVSPELIAEGAAQFFKDQIEFTLHGFSP